MSYTYQYKKYYFGPWLRVGGPIFGAVISFYFWHFNIEASQLKIWSITLGAALLLWSTFYKTSILMKKSSINDRFYFLFLPIRIEHILYKDLNYILIEKERIKYNAPTRSRDRKTDFTEYTSFLVYDSDNKKFEWDRSTDYQSFVDETNHMSEKLNLDIVRGW